MRGRREWILAGAVGLCCAALSLLVLRRGIGISPDGWRYWQTSVSLLSGRGFVDLYGLPELQSPPGYPLYLALWQALFGVSGATLVASVAVALGAAGFCWSVFVFRVLGGEGPADPRLVWPALLSIVLVLPATHAFLLSEVVFHALVPVVLIAAQVAWTREDGRALMRASLGLGLALAAAALVRNVAIVLVPAALLAVALGSPTARRERLAAAALTSVVAVLPWWASRAWLEQGGGHFIGFGAGSLGPAEYGRHMIEGLGGHLAPAPWGLVLLGCLAVGYVLIRAESFRVGADVLVRVRRHFAIVLLGFAGLYLLFNVVHIGNLPRGRFTLFVSLAVLPLVLAVLQSHPRRALALTATVVLLLAPASRLVWLCARGVVPESLDLHSAEVPRAIGFDTTIVPACTAGLQPFAGRWLVGPPLYPAFERRLDAHAQALSATSLAAR